MPAKVPPRMAVIALCCIQTEKALKRGQNTMKNILWVVGGLCAAAAGFLVWGPKRIKPIQELAHSLDVAWSDHHTIV